jgi:ABC-type nitrate/sulfonate/bicarbonate transport system substrate-binding protein
MKVLVEAGQEDAAALFLDKGVGELEVSWRDGWRQVRRHHAAYRIDWAVGITVVRLVQS